MEELGDRLRRYRERAGLSIYDVEKIVGKHFTTISKYERGERQPSVRMLRELAGVYEVPVGRLVADVEESSDLFPEEVIVAAHLLEKRPDLMDLLPELEYLDPVQIDALHSFLRSIIEK
ncbi:MAG: helix-turn-helix domain-containing protein [Bacillota bacterium]